MTVQTDHDQTIDVTGKIEQAADILRHALRKGIKDGALTPEMIQNVNENGSLFAELAIPALIEASRRVAMVGKMIDSELLEPMTMVSVPAVPRFKAKDKFREGKTVDGVKVYGTGSNFDAHFMGKVEKDVATMQLRAHKLRKGSKDPAIIEALGGTGLVETSLAQMWEMMKKQGEGQEGDLLTNGYANIFYVPDTEGVIWAVGCSWRGSSWGVGAGPLSFPFDWYAGHQVFSR